MATEDILINDGDGFVSLSALAAEQVDANLPIQSDDGTVVLDSPSANVFTVSTGGAERVGVSDTDATFSVPVRTSTIGGLADTDPLIGFTNVINFQFMNSDTSLGSKINVGYNESSGTGFANVGVGGCYWYLRDSKRFGIGATGINFNANAAANATTYDWKMEPDGTFVANADRGIETAYITAGRHNSNNAPETAPQITLNGTQVTLGLKDGNAYAPLTNDSIPTKKYVDELIWIGTQAEYDALGIYDNKRLYCITD